MVPKSNGFAAGGSRSSQVVSTPLPSNGSSMSGWTSRSNTPLALTGEVSATTVGSCRTRTSPNVPSRPVVTREMPLEYRVARIPRSGRHERDQADAHLADQPQVVAREVGVEQGHRGGERERAGAAEVEELHRHQPGQGERLGQVEPPPFGAEGVLVEAGQVLGELLGAGQAPAVGLRGARVGWSGDCQ